MDTKNIVYIKLTTIQCLIVINFPLKVPKVPLFNLVFNLISIAKIFTVNGNIFINIVVIIIIILILILIVIIIIILILIIIIISMNIIMLYMCKILILSIRNYNL